MNLETTGGPPGTPIGEATPEPTGPSAVVHASDHPRDLERAVATAGRIRAATPGVAVRVIVNGAALQATQGTQTLTVPDGVEVAACEAGLASQHLPVARLRPGIGTVPSAAWRWWRHSWPGRRTCGSRAVRLGVPGHHVGDGRLAGAGAPGA